MKKTDLIRKIRNEFPQLKWHRTVHNVEGWDHYVLILDNLYVFRFPRKSAYLRKLHREIGLLEYLHNKISVPIPQYIFVSRDKSFAGYAILRGQQLKPEIFWRLPTAIQDRIARQLAGFMSVLHRVPIRTARRYGPEVKNPTQSYRETVAKARKVLYPKFSAPDRAATEAFFRDLRLVPKFPRQVLVHNDLYPSHILLATDRQKLSGIIDFADRALDDPALDLGELWVYGRRFVETIYHHYTGPKDKNFLRRSQLYYRRVPIWMMISALTERKGNFQQQYKIFREIFRDYRYPIRNQKRTSTV